MLFYPNRRHNNIQLEEEIEKMICEFDGIMFQLHNEIDQLRAVYETEKLELGQARHLLDETERRKFEIVDLKHQEEADERNQVRYRKPETVYRIRETVYRKPDTVNLIPDARYRMSGQTITCR